MRASGGSFRSPSSIKCLFSCAPSLFALVRRRRSISPQQRGSEESRGKWILCVSAGRGKGHVAELGDETVVFPAHCGDVAHAPRTQPQAKQGETEPGMFPGPLPDVIKILCTQTQTTTRYCVNFSVYQRQCKIGK